MKPGLGSNVSTICRVLAATLLLAVYIAAYFPFAAWVQQRWSAGYPFLLPHFAVVAAMSAALVACRVWFRPRTLPTRIAFWLSVVSTAATWLGLCLLLLPQHGDMGIGVFFLFIPLQVNAILIPAALFSLLSGLIYRERVTLILGGFVFLLTASFCFSALHYSIPWALDKITGTSWFSKMVHRYRVEPTRQSLPVADEMVKDIALIKKGPLDPRKLYHLETAAWKAPQHCGAIIDQIIDQFPTVKDFEERRRALGQIHRLSIYYPEPPVCRHDLVFFYSQIMERREGDLSDNAAGALTTTEFRKLLTQDKYLSVLHAVAKYALERQEHAPQLDTLRFATNRTAQPGYRPDAPWFMYRTFDCVPQVTAAASNLLQQPQLSPADQKITTNLLLFAPYLQAREGDTGEPYAPHVRKQCATAQSWLKRLQEKSGK